MIDVSDVDLVELAKAAYDLSKAQGLGFIHYKNGGLSNEEAKAFIENDGMWALRMDYVKGRSCKLTVFRTEWGLYMSNAWYDHSSDDLERLLERVGISA